MVSKVAAGEKWNSKSKLEISSRGLKGWIAIQRALVGSWQAIRCRLGVENGSQGGTLAFVSCWRSFGDNFAQAFGAIWLSRGSSAVIVFRAIL